MKLSLIPQPNSIKTNKGSLPIKDSLTITFVTHEISLFTEASLLKSDLKKFINLKCKISASLQNPKCGIVLSIKPMKSSYALSITKDYIIIEAPEKKGIFYGIQTFLQIAIQSELNLPLVQIKDSPQFPIRGFYHDITRSKVPTLETLKGLVDKISFYKLNHLQLYIEHTFAFKNLPELWIDKDPITAEEILELDEYAQKRHVELVPSLSTFGHMYEMLRIKKLEHLNELDIKASEAKHCLRDRMAHYTLDANQAESFELVKSLLNEFIPLFKSKLFNICCDETFDLGEGKNKTYAKKHGKTRLYLDFLKKIISYVKGHDKTVMFWGDIILKEPKFIKEIPKDTICLNWSYGTKPNEMDSKIFATNKMKQILCPGVTGWNNIMNPIDHSILNISKMAQFAKKYNTLGILNTDWGDMGHVNMLTNSMYGMAFGAECSWSKKIPSVKEFDSKISLLEWRDSNAKIAPLLREMGTFNIYNFRLIYCWLNSLKDNSGLEDKVMKMNPSELYKIKIKLNKIKQELLSVLRKSNIPDIDKEELLWSNDALVWSINLVLCKLKYEQNKKVNINTKQTIKDGYAMIENYQNIWRTRNKESELRHTRNVFIQACDWLELTQR